jgi:ribosomal protein S1
MRTRLAIFICALAASAASAETYSLTNGATIKGTVVSGIVAQVVIRMADGSTRAIPVQEFAKTERSRLPQDAAGIYVWYSELRRICDESVATQSDAVSHLKTTVENANDLIIQTAKDNLRRAVEIQAWEESNDMWGEKVDAINRKMYVLKTVREHLTEVPAKK